MILYKYYEPERVHVLETRSIALTQPRAFNDPFELSPHYGMIMEPPPGSADVEMFANEGIKNAYRLQKTDPVVVLSLSERRDNLLMWAHYADSHRGFLIGFDGDQEILKSESAHRRLKQVVYSEDRPSKPTWDEVTDEELLLTKGEDWTHEREWRLLDSLFSSDADVPVGRNQQSWIFRLRPQAIAEVIIGCQAGADFRHRLAEILADPDYQHVQFLKAELDPRHYRLNFVTAP